jgi:zinc protease
MMFKGTINFENGKFDQILEAAGVEGENAFTSRDYTAYVQELPKDKLDLIAKLESDRMLNLTINESAFRTEREVIQNERRFRNENNPDGLLDQALFETAFTRHPYHWPVIGYKADLNQMTSQDALNFYQRFYSPSNAVIVITGDVVPEEASNIVEKYYGNLSGHPSSQSLTQNVRLSPQEEPQMTPRRKQLKMNIQVEKLILAYKTPGSDHEDTVPLDVIQNLLAGGKSSRLYHALVETGIASSVETENLESKDPSLFAISVNLQKGKRATQAESIILKELERLTQQLVGTQELDRAKNLILFDFYNGLESNFLKAYFLGQSEIIDRDFMKGFHDHEKTQKITPLQIQTVAKRYFNPQTRTVITGVPK